MTHIPAGGLRDATSATARTGSLERLARLAARLLGCPAARASLVGGEDALVTLPGPWTGGDAPPVPPDLCRQVVATGESLVISDARDDPSPRDGATGQGTEVVAYAGIPLVARGECVGALCVVDAVPRDWSRDDLSALEDLAAAAAAELELRLLVAEREDAVAEARRSEERFRALVEGMAEGVVLHDADGSIVACNPAAERILGLSSEQMTGRTPRDPRWRAVREDGTPLPAEEHPAVRTRHSGRSLRDVIMGVHRADGRLRWISVGTDTLPGGRSEDGPMVLSTFMDVTERREAEHALRADTAQQAALTRVATLVASGAAPADVFATVAREAARVLDAAAAGVVRCDPEEVVRVVGTWSFEGLPRPALGSPVSLDAPTAVARALRERRPARVTGYKGLEGVGDVPYRCGAACPVHVGGRLWGAVTVAATEIAGFDDAATSRLERFADLVALAVSGAEARERLVGLATTDDLTSVANPRAFRTRLDQEVGRAVRHGRPLSLVTMDIDHFKEINDEHGHPVGDRVLAAVARRLQVLARGEELLARVGGEEFSWILPEADARQAHAAALRAVRAVRREPFPGVGRVTISAGVCDLPPNASSAELVKGADLALYAAKAAGRDCVADPRAGRA